MATKSPRNGTDIDEALYDQYIVTLTLIGTSQCGLSRAEAEVIANDVLLAAIAGKPRIADLDAWLTGAMLAAAQRRARGSR
jgi:hypothetical protein